MCFHFLESVAVAQHGHFCMTFTVRQTCRDFQDICISDDKYQDIIVSLMFNIVHERCQLITKLYSSA